MLYLDLMRNAELRQCGLPDCMEYFRPGAQTSLYCTPQHGSLATTRKYLLMRNVDRPGLNEPNG